MLCLGGVAQTGQKVGYRVSHRHCVSSPTRLRHPGDVSVVGQLPQADPAHAELAVHGTRAAATAASRVAPGLVLRRPLLADAL
jgi:hypothetical protein